MESQISTRKPKTLPRLSQLIISKLKRHVSQITDIGDAPFHLLEPILQQMPSKQLNELEENCQKLKPYSDKLWMNLISKDFPNRPIKLDPLKSSSSSKNHPLMPYKSLYYKYCKDRDEFRKDSARKLRNANKFIEKEKSKTKIIAVNQVLRDPSVRKVNYLSSSYTGNVFNRSIQPINKNSILQRAKRDTLHSRNLLFARNQQIKPYDPFHAFKVYDKNSNNNNNTIIIRPPRKTTNIRRTTFFNATSNSLKSSSTSNNTSSLSKSPRTKQDASTRSEINKLSSISPLKPPFNRQNSSIFIQQKRKSPSPITTNTSTAKRIKKLSRTKETPSKLKELKSSIFS